MLLSKYKNTFTLDTTENISVGLGGLEIS